MDIVSLANELEDYNIELVHQFGIDGSSSKTLKHGKFPWPVKCEAFSRPQRKAPNLPRSISEGASLQDVDAVRGAYVYGAQFYIDISPGYRMASR